MASYSSASATTTRKQPRRIGPPASAGGGNTGISTRPHAGKIGPPLTPGGQGKKPRPGGGRWRKNAAGEGGRPSARPSPASMGGAMQPAGGGGAGMGRRPTGRNVGMTRQDVRARNTANRQAGLGAWGQGGGQPGVPGSEWMNRAGGAPFKPMQGQPPIGGKPQMGNYGLGAAAGMPRLWSGGGPPGPGMGGGPFGGLSGGMGRQMRNRVPFSR